MFSIWLKIPWHKKNQKNFNSEEKQQSMETSPNLTLLKLKGKDFKLLLKPYFRNEGRYHGNKLKESLD